MRILAAAFVLAVAVMLGGCSSPDCLAVRCHDGLVLSFDHPFWEPGRYVVEGRADELTFRCEAELVEERGELHRVSATCDDERVNFVVVGLGFVDVHPRTVSLELHRDDLELGAWTVHPTYEEIAPNAVECGSVCNRAQELVSF